MRTDDIRSSFLEFFRERDHVIERSDRIVPSNDPTLLFTSAGMVQFKPFYSGELAVPYRRAATSQKCLRAGGKANDLDEVGKTTRHMTFFEMLGNFSFGDYFKREAIAWAWEYVTQVLKMPAGQIWVSVFHEDDEAYDIWHRDMGVSEARLVRLGAKENFWGPAGDTGACGPCSELLYDRGADIDPNADPEKDPQERFIEFWNLVFPQYDQQPDGSRPPLKNRGIDTGMGLERLAALLQDKPTVFDTDLLFPIIAATQELSGASYADTPVPFRVIADHVRALGFMIADGILPSNEGRGYVERRLLRRAARFGRELGLEKPFLHELTAVVVELMGRQYPELRENALQIEKIVHTEEARFGSTLARGMDMLDATFEQMQKEGAPTVSGDVLFRLHDTYGFPLELAADIADDRGYKVDREGFDRAMAQQRERARAAWTGSGEEALAPAYRRLHETHGDSKFVGYDSTHSFSKVLALVKKGDEVGSLAEGEEGEAILDETPFYAESGGQVGDTGVLEASEGAAHVVATACPVGKMHVHKIRVTQGRISAGEPVQAAVDLEKRRPTASHHTATHLLQAALREILGEHVHQAGSLVAPEHLRFDFTHFEGVDRDRLLDIESQVNEYIRQDAPVKAKRMPLDEARSEGATALFGEKYEDVVRVIEVEGISKELCGGTHVPTTGVIGLFKVLSESSISAGVRRIEAVCGKHAVAAVQEREQAAQEAGQLLKAGILDLPERVRSLQDENKKLQREVQRWKQAAASGGSVDYQSKTTQVNGVSLLATEIEGQDAAGLRMIMDKLRDQLGTGVVVLGGVSEGKVALCVGVSKDLTDRIRAGDIVKNLAPIVGGGGGGRPDMAQAGGKLPEKLPEALAKASEVVESLLHE